MSVGDFLESSRTIEKKHNTTNLSLYQLPKPLLLLFVKKEEENPDEEDVDDEENEEKRP